jgi:hypothetical protein
MLNNIIAHFKPAPQPEAAPKPAPKAPAKQPQPSTPPAPATAAEPAPIDQSPRAIALRAAEAAGWKAGEIQPRAKILRHQPAKMFLLVEVENWGEPVICHVKDVPSWLPVDPRFSTLDARFCGTATAEGRLLFESPDICKAKRARDR